MDLTLEELTARIVLTKLKGIGPGRAKALTSYCGDATTVINLKEQDIRGNPAFSPTVCQALLSNKKQAEKNLINIFGNKDKILDDLSIPLDIINSKDFKVSGKLNDIVRANNIRQYQNQHSNVFSTRVNYDDNPDSEITIFEGSDAYLKMITEHYSQNTIAILSPDDVHFNDAINIANSNYQRNMIDLNNEDFLNFSNKYPCMAYWRKK